MSRQEYKMSEGTYLKAISMKACGYHVSLYKNTFDKKKKKWSFLVVISIETPFQFLCTPPPPPSLFSGLYRNRIRLIEQLLKAASGNPRGIATRIATVSL